PGRRQWDARRAPAEPPRRSPPADQQCRQPISLVCRVCRVRRVYRVGNRFPDSADSADSADSTDSIDFPMEFGITVPTGKPFDAVALGLNAVDHLIVAPRYPEFNSKVRYKSHQLAAGGQCASAMVALARLGLRARYIGKVGDDDIGRFQINSVVSEGVTADIRVVEGAETQTAFIIIDEASGERTILWSRDAAVATPPEEVDEAAVTSGRVLHLDGHDV